MTPGGGGDIRDGGYSDIRDRREDVSPPLRPCTPIPVMAGLDPATQPASRSLY